jgi:predicted MPP superfamily phosphohydrolase
MKPIRLFRFLAWGSAVFLLLAGACLLYALRIEPRWLNVVHVDLRPGSTRHCRIALISDIHYEGDRAYLLRVVEKVNQAGPDFVCFAGDLADSAELADEADGILAGIHAPVYAVRGNHDACAQELYATGFAAGGGGWLDGRSVLLLGGKIELAGLSLSRPASFPSDQGAPIRILLCHYTVVADNCGDRTFDLILAGHSHGGQVRIPFYGAVLTPYDTGRYEKGLYRTHAGPLYVNPGIGNFFSSVRFNCRPEITVIDL